MGSIVAPSNHTRRTGASARRWSLWVSQDQISIAHEAKERADERRLIKLRKMQKYLRAVCEHNGIAITN